MFKKSQVLFLEIGNRVIEYFENKNKKFIEATGKIDKPIE